LQETHPAPHKSDYWQYAYVLVLLPCLIYTVAYTARAIRLDYTAVPIWDSWRSVQFLDQMLGFDIRHFWVQHNEHRIVFPEIVYSLDYIFFQGVQTLPIACNIACQLGQLALLGWLLWRMQDMPPPFRLTLGICCGLFMTSAMQVQGILGTFELQWYLSEMAAALAFVFLRISARSGRWTSLAMSIAAAVIVTYSTGNGMFIWPVLVTMAALLRLPKPRIAVVAIAGTLSIAAYFVGYSFLTPGRFAVLLDHPFYAIWFVGVFLGTPLSYVNVQLGGVAGLAGLLLVAFALTIAIRQRRLADPLVVVTAGVCLYIAGSALMIAYGRMNPADPAIAAALAARYVGVPLTYCANLVVLVGWLVMQLPRGRRFALHSIAALLVLAVAVTVMNRQKSYERTFAMQQALAHESGIAMVAGIEEDDDVSKAIFPDPQFLREMTPKIRQRRLSIFAAGRQDWIGQPVNGVFVPAPEALCFGGVEMLSPVTGGYRAAGWAWDRAMDRPPRDIVLVNRAGVIVGFGETRPGGYPRNDPARRPPSDWDWAGFARSTGMSGTIQAYAIVHRGQMACAMGSPRPAPSIERIPASRVGAPIHISEWKADPAWTLNGFHPSVGTLGREVLYGSYSGSDANQGVLTSAPFTAGGQACIALPVAHGPSVGGQSVRLVESDSGKTVQSIPLSETSGTWQYWAVELQGVDKLRIVAEDRGRQFGQWVAVGEPHLCQSH
jgi:hypothetical protein